MPDPNLQKAFEHMKDTKHEPESPCNEALNNSTIITKNGEIERIGDGDDKGTKPEYPNQDFSKKNE